MQEVLFEELLTKLRELEPDRQLIEVEFDDIFSTDWSVLNPRTPSAIITLGNEYKMSRRAFFQLVKIMNHLLGTNTIDAKYLWSYPDVIAFKMPAHVMDYTVLRDTSIKRSHNRIKLMLHGDVITSIMSTNYVDYSNLQIIESFIKECEDKDLVPKSYTYKLDKYGDELEFIPIFQEFVEGTNLYGAGILITNSQNKSLGFTISPIVKSTICNNSILSWWSQTHRHDSGIAEFANVHLAVVYDLIDLAVDTYENYIAALDINIDPTDMPQILAWLRREFNLTKAHMVKLQEGVTSEFTTAEGTLFGLVSGITYMVNFLDESRYDEGARLLRFAGRLLQLNEQDMLYFADISGAK